LDLIGDTLFITIPAVLFILVTYVYGAHRLCQLLEHTVSTQETTAKSSKSGDGTILRFRSQINQIKLTSRLMSFFLFIFIVAAIGNALARPTARPNFAPDSILTRVVYVSVACALIVVVQYVAQHLHLAPLAPTGVAHSDRNGHQIVARPSSAVRSSPASSRDIDLRKTAGES